jgi:hypothetical protein
MRRAAVMVLGVGAGLGMGVAASTGCQDKKDPHAGHDHRPRPEGRLEVDQSAVLPVDVRAGVQREYPGATVQEVQKRVYDNRTVRYEVHLTTKDGRQVVKEFDESGRPSSPK